MGKGNIELLAGHAKKLARTEKDPLKLWMVVMEKALAEIDYKEINLKERGWTVGFDRAIKRFGVCCVNEKHISLSGIILKETSQEVNEWVDIILHEMAHAFDSILHHRPKAHGKSWKKICKDIGAAPVRCCHDAKLNQCSDFVASQRNKKQLYLITCPDCDAIRDFSTKSTPYRFDCRYCGVPLEALKLTPDILLEWAEVIYDVEGEETLEYCIESLEPTRELFDSLMQTISGWEYEEDAVSLVVKIFQFQAA